VTLNKVLFESDIEDHLVVELFGEELDTFSANDELDRYRREFRGPVDDWVALYEPADEGSSDPEAMSNWRISYIIEKA
jgi:predicted RNA-binding Zn ribbon-like protein